VGAVFNDSCGLRVDVSCNKKDFEPLLLLPIGFGAFLTNLPLNGLLTEPSAANNFIGGLYFYLSKGIELEIFPPLIFLGIGAMTDFGPLRPIPRLFCWERRRSLVCLLPLGLLFCLDLS
jgi:Na+-transporting methylmalonyl-CoA/oxaloacetate decarboxylase beta subunit